MHVIYDRGIEIIIVVNTLTVKINCILAHLQLADCGGA